MSKQAADHHKKAAEHHEHAAQNHKEAAKYLEAGNHEKAAHYAHLAHAHHLHVAHHSAEATKSHLEHHGKKQRVRAGASRSSGFTQIRVDSRARPGRVSRRKGIHGGSITRE